MNAEFNFQEIERRWQEAWKKDGTYRAKDSKPSDKAQKFYGLIEFPYPSGEGLHVGHPRSYTAIDIVTRKKRMEGKNVLYPIGWDAFGLPTENFAIKHKIKPADATKKNVTNFTRQLKSLGFGFDWSREINTTDPKYYKWTQWMFLQFYGSYYDEKEMKAQSIEVLPIPKEIFSQGEKAIAAYRDSRRLAYKASSTINWCPSCKIGLANEEAQGGVCERCGAKVEKRVKAQWMIRITAYAERLIADLDTVDYLDRIRTQQINWIGKSEGAQIDFQIAIENGQAQNEIVEVFTTRPDTLYGVTYLVLAPEHELIREWLKRDVIKNAEDVRAYLDASAAKTDIERQENKTKTGAALEGIFAIHPITAEKIPVWTSDYVLANYGTGAVMAVPAHDERDGEFARSFNLPSLQVVFPGRAGEAESVRICLETLKEVAPLFERENVEVYLEGGLAFAFHHGIAYRSANDVDLIARDEAHCVHACEILKNAGWTIVEANGKRKASKDGSALIELMLPSALDFPGHSLQESDFDQTMWELWGVKARMIAFKYQRAFKEWQATTRDKITDRIDLEWMDRCGFFGEGVSVNSGELTLKESDVAYQKIIDKLEFMGSGRRVTNYKLRDWVFSRQRYWGEPIPMIFCETCGVVPVPESQLPVPLPEVEHYQPTDTGESPLAAIADWVNVSCPHCGGAAKRETDTMPNWAGSSWYFLRYVDPKNEIAFADPEKLKFWMPVDLYNGGMEHTTLHLLYSRFWYKFLWDRGFVPEECGAEPYSRRRSHALILGEDGIKMSKSKGNVVNPDDVVAEYGADVFRVYEMFIGPFDAAAPWDTNGIEGVKRFLNRVWSLYNECIQHGLINENVVKEDTEILLHKTIKKVSEDIENLKFNTAISAMMIFLNGIEDYGPGHEIVSPEHAWNASGKTDTTLLEDAVASGGLNRIVVESFLKILAPFAPHLTEELWHRLDHKDSIHHAAWPEYDVTKLQAETFELVIQINGKVRDRLTVATNISEDDAKQQALASLKIQELLNGRMPTKIVYVPGRLVSISVD